MLLRRINKNIAEYQNELISKHCNEVENIYRQMRGWKHDYHSHIQAIKAYIALGQIEELSGYCDRLEQDLQSVDTVLKTGHIMLDAVLNSKLSLARHKNIEVHIKAIVPKALKITDVDLCVLMGNLLDNAMEACENRQPDSALEFDHPFIRVYIGMKGNHLYICVTNTVLNNKKKTGPFHGFGLIRVDKICSKYGGYCNRNKEPGAFTTEILLPVGTDCL